MRQMTKKIGKVLYRDGPMLVASFLFAGIFLQNINNITS